MVSKSKYLRERTKKRKSSRKEGTNLDIKKLLRMEAYKNEEEIMIDFYDQLKY